MMKYRVMLEYIPSNPFELFLCSYKKVKREFLDQEELDFLFIKEFTVKRLEEVRDCYLFSCYTGSAYSDAAALTPDDIAIGIDGEKWIIRNRIKTDTTENVPLLPISLEIIEKYRNHDYCKTLKYVAPETAFEVFHKLPIELCEDSNY